MAAEEGHPSSPLPPLPMDCVPSILSPQERRLLYDYVVEVYITLYVDASVPIDASILMYNGYRLEVWFLGVN